MSFTVYILQSDATGGYYIGSTGNLSQRLQKHASGATPYTRSRGPWRLVYTEEYPLSREARRRELAIKRRKSRKYIQRLISESRTLS